MEQKQPGGVTVPGFAIEDVEPIDVDRAVSNRCHLEFSLLCDNLFGEAKKVECRFPHETPQRLN